MGKGPRMRLERSGTTDMSALKDYFIDGEAQHSHYYEIYLYLCVCMCFQLQSSTQLGSWRIHKRTVLRVEEEKKQNKCNTRTFENSCGSGSDGEGIDKKGRRRRCSFIQVRLDKRRELRGQGDPLRCTLIAHLYCALPSTQHEPNQLEIIPGNDRTGLNLTCH